MDYKRSLAAFLLCFFLMFVTTTEAVAETSLPVFASLDVMLLSSKLGVTQDLNLLDGVGNTYVAQKKQKSTASAMFGLGVQTYHARTLIFNTSVRYLPLPKTTLQGDVWQLQSSRFNNLTYSYNLQSDVFFAENIASWTRHLIQPSFILGLGAARHKTGYYQETALNHRASAGLTAFGNATQTELAYEIGAALDYPCKNIMFELAYRFMDLGQGHLGASTLQNTQARLSTGRIRYQSISLGGRAHYG